ncbi:MAG TPA: hypothetical protein VJ840_01510 [Gemmatimonadaceae bacterium]|nr:hypothetical protein [Gemmatimonadaceae bacterium]
MKTASFIAGFGLIALAACRNPFASDPVVMLDVTELTAPSTIAATSALDIVLTVIVNGCQRFDRIQVVGYASGATLTVWGPDASVDNKDVVCPTVIKSEPHGYRFNPPFSGTFDITVDRGRLSPLRATVQIQ